MGIPLIGAVRSFLEGDIETAKFYLASAVIMGAIFYKVGMFDHNKGVRSRFFDVNKRISDIKNGIVNIGKYFDELLQPLQDAVSTTEKTQEIKLYSV